jgi:hypothetical protein
VIHVVGAHGSADGGSEIRQPLGLGVDSLFAGGERERTAFRDRTAATDVDVEVEAVLDDLGVRLRPEPDARAAASMPLEFRGWSELGRREIMWSTDAPAGVQRT